MSFLIFLAIMLLLLWILQFFLLDDVYKVIKQFELTITADRLAEENDNEELYNIAAELAEKREICVRIFKMQNKNTGQIIVNIDSLQNCLIHNTERYTVFTLYDAAEKNGGRFIERFRFNASTRSFYSVSGNIFSDNDDEESMVLSQIVKDTDGNETLIILNSVLSPVSATVQTLFILLCGISVVMLIIASSLAFILSKLISDPIVKINKNAKELANGNYGINFDMNGYREISELGETLNYTAGELEKVDTLRRELIANVSHDLRTPLTLITGYAEAMRDFPDENSAENTQIIIDEAKRMTSLVTDMLDISKLEAGIQNINISEINITESVRGALDRYNKFLDKKEYCITFDYDNEYTVSTDESKMLQALCNLINNAVTYTGEDKLVAVKQELVRNGEESFIRLSVTDTGEGIEEDKLPLIWERYYKADKVHKRAAVGTGLGLSIVSKIMKMLGGSCGVRSTVGAGSTFWIDVPYKNDR